MGGTHSVNHANSLFHNNLQNDDKNLYEQMRSSDKLGLMESLFNDALYFVANTWENNMNIIGIQMNSCLNNDCPSCMRFYEAIKQSDVKLEDSFFAWHGTNSESNIKQICCQGFDPSLRQRQAYGQGEYFGTTANVSISYSNNTSRLIVVLILNRNVKKPNNQMYVVENPNDKSCAYVLPILVVTFNNNTNNIVKLPLQFNHEFCQNKSKLEETYLIKGNNLLNLLKSNLQQPKIYSKQELILVLLRELTWNLKLVVFGGAIRDWIICGNIPKDIDVKFLNDTEKHKQYVIKYLKSFDIKYGLKVIDKGWNNLAYVLTFILGSNIIDLELSSPYIIKTSPYVECDVSNLCIYPGHGLTLRYPNAKDGFNLFNILKHCQLNIFYFFYDFSVENRNMSITRIKKYLSKGWICLNFFPKDVEDELKFNTKLNNIDNNQLNLILNYKKILNEEINSEKKNRELFINQLSNISISNYNNDIDKALSYSIKFLELERIEDEQLKQALSNSIVLQQSEDDDLKRALELSLL